MSNSDHYLLALDTSGASLSVAFLHNKVVMAEKLLNISNQHSINLLPALDSLAQEAGLSYEQLSYIAVTVGPGSFTGIRIGVSTANAMAYGLNIPVIGVSSLEVLADPFKTQGNTILPSFDARGGRVFAAVFKAGERLIADHQFVDQELPILLKEKFAEHTFTLIGDGSLITQKLLEQNGLKYKRKNSDLTVQDFISASVLGQIALQKIELNPDQYQAGYQSPVRPNYCVLSQAERNLRRKSNT